MDIYQRIKRAREAKGWSMQELAEKVGYSSRSAIARVETGDRSVNHEMLVKYAEALEVSPLWLLYGDKMISQNHYDGQKLADFDFCFSATKQFVGYEVDKDDVIFVKKNKEVKNGELVLVSIIATHYLAYWHYDESTKTVYIQPQNELSPSHLIFTPSEMHMLNYLGTVVFIGKKPKRRDDGFYT